MKIYLEKFWSITIKIWNLKVLLKWSQYYFKITIFYHCKL